MFENLRRWLNGAFECRGCGKIVYSMSFGCGETICPDCYDGEDPFLFPDKENVLNRIVWGLIPLKDMTGDEVAQFIDELSDAMTILSMEGFKVIFQLADAPEEPFIEIKADG